MPDRARARLVIGKKKAYSYAENAVVSRTIEWNA
jgi:hypothetical protein